MVGMMVELLLHDKGQIQIIDLDRPLPAEMIEAQRDETTDFCSPR
jgi:hypothetical protein